MKDLSAMSSTEEVDALIDEICRHMPGLQAQAESRTWTREERAVYPKLDAVCKALERRAELRNGELQSSMAH